LRHTQGRKFTRAFGPVFFCVTRRTKIFFGARHFFLEPRNLGHYAASCKGEGEDDKRAAVNKLLTAWAFSHVLLVGCMHRPRNVDFVVHFSPESDTNDVRGKRDRTTV
jgi:hypothetical protein